MDPISENEFPNGIALAKLDTYKDYSKPLLAAKEKLKNSVWFRILK